MTEQAHSLAEYITQLRGKKSIKAFAGELGIGQYTVRRAEAGRPLNPSTITKIVTCRRLPQEDADLLRTLAAQTRKPKTIFKAATTQLDLSEEYPDEAIASRAYPEQLAYLRQRAGLTYEDITQRGGPHANTVGKIEQGGIRRPSQKTLQRLRTGLGLPDDSPILQPKPIPRHSTVKHVPEIPPEELANMTPEKKLAYWRKRERLGQPAIAQKLDVSPSLVKKWENGNKKPTKRQREALAEALHIPVEELHELFTPPVTSLAELITFYREDHGLSKAQLSLASGLNSATIRLIEQGDTPSQETIQKLIATFGFAPDSIEANRLRQMMADLYFARRNH